MRQTARSLSVLVVLAVALGALLAVAPASSAETKRGVDPRGDVRLGDQGSGPRSGRGNGDLVGYRISYDRQRLQIVLSTGG